MSASISELLYARLQCALAEENVTEIINIARNKNVNVNQRDVTRDLQTPLMTICYSKIDHKSMKNILDVIMTKTPDVNLQDSSGRSAIMHACIAGRQDVFDYLLRNTQVRINLLDFEGDSVLVYAIQWGSSFAVKSILAYSSGQQLISIHNCHGQSPLGIAQQLSSKEMCILLERPTHMFNISSGEKKRELKGCSSTFGDKPINYSRSPDVGKKLHNKSKYLNMEDTEKNVKRDQLSLSMSNSSKFKKLYEKQKHPSLFSVRKQGSKISLRSMEDKIATLEEESWKLKAGKRRGSLSLPDLRDMTGCLVTSGETTPASTLSSNDCESPNILDNESEDDECGMSHVYPINDNSRSVISKPDKHIALPEINKGLSSLCSPKVKRSLKVENPKRGGRLHMIAQRTS